VHLQVDIITGDEAAYKKMGSALGSMGQRAVKSKSQRFGRDAQMNKFTEKFSESVVTSRSVPLVFTKRKKPSKMGPEVCSNMGVLCERWFYWL
jgi:hypothetical protein